MLRQGSAPRSRARRRGGAFVCAALAALLAAAPAAAEETQAPGHVFRDCPDCPDMVVVPDGRFLMGWAAGKKNARPVHEVRIPRPFAIGVYEVTFEEWRHCREAGACAREPDDHRWGRGRRPVINVSWEDAMAYVAHLSEVTGQRCRLPSEAEWEFAARAGTDTTYWWGEEPGENRANCRKCGTEWAGHLSAPVGSFAPNAFGLYDSAGNVWEWVADCYRPTYEGATTDGSVWEGGDCEMRSARGGSWYYNPRVMASASRFGHASPRRQL